MSWDVTLTYRGVRTDWNYTHNCNAMIETALEAADVPIETTKRPWWSAVGLGVGAELIPALGRCSWWELLDRRTGAEGHQLLTALVKELESDPPKYMAMNPENGWGSYKTLLEVLRDMRDAVPMEEPSQWEASG